MIKRLQILSQQREQLIAKIKAARLEHTKLSKSEVSNQIHEQEIENNDLRAMKAALEKMLEARKKQLEI